ncbi:hypothetical protein N8261_04705 [Flavobacteriaceae bacterium]|nr:hypothetical protein [Flavobacteriaceae bacterium]
MNELLNVSNPKMKIDGVLNNAKANREKKMEELKKEIMSLDTQMKDEKYYMQPESVDGMSAEELGLAIIYIISSVFDGFSSAAARLRNQTNQKLDQMGGANTDADAKELDKVSTNADKLSKIANKAKERTTDLAKQVQSGELVKNVQAKSSELAKQAQSGELVKNAQAKSSELAKQAQAKSSELAKQAQAKSSELAKQVQSGELVNKIKATSGDFAKNIRTKSTEMANKIRQQSLGHDDGSSVTSKLSDLGKASVKTGIKWSENFISFMIDMGMKLSGNDKILDTPLDELSPELNKQIILLAGVLTELSENPATHEAIKEIAEAIAISVVEILQDIQPSLDKITDQALEMLDEVGDKSVRGFTSTGISVMQAFLAEIPWVGGIIDLFIAFGKGFNAIMQTYKVVVDRGGKLGVQTAKAAVNTEQSVVKGKERIENATDKAMETIKDSRADKVNKEVTQSGGEYISCKRTNNRIKMGGKRLKKTMKLFHSTLPKLKYPLSSCYNKQKSGKKSRKR